MKRVFWPLVQSHEYLWSSQSFPSDITAGDSSRILTVKNISIPLTQTVALFVLPHFPNGCHHRNRDSGKHHCVQFVHPRTRDHHKFFGFRLNFGWWRVAPFFRKREECSFLILFQFGDFLCQLPRCFASPTLVPFCLHLRPFLKFWIIRVSLMTFARASFVERWIWVSNFGIAHCVFSESNTSDWFSHGWAPCLEIRNPNSSFLSP